MMTSPRKYAGEWSTSFGYQTDEERDASMTEASDDDIAWVRPNDKKKRRSGTQKNRDRRKEKNLRVHLAERATWEKAHVREELTDDGETRWMIVDRHDNEWYPPTHTDVPLPPGLRARLAAATIAYIEARRQYHVVQQELARATYDKEAYKD
jgi:hypothetical protein